jgi:hypothetical protein
MLAQSITHHSVDVKRHGPAKLLGLKHRWQKQSIAKVKVIKPTNIKADAANAQSFAGLAG